MSDAAVYGARYLSNRLKEQGYSAGQAAYLQLLVLISFEVFLRRKEASHSRMRGEKSRWQQGERTKEPWWKRNWTHENSLTLAFLVLSVVAFGLHIWFGHYAFNDVRFRQHQPLLSARQYFVSPRFWFESCEIWEAEFLAIGIFMVLSIYLRQTGGWLSPSRWPKLGIHQGLRRARILKISQLLTAIQVTNGLTYEQRGQALVIGSNIFVKR